MHRDRLIELRDVVVPSIGEDFSMEQWEHCVGGHACRHAPFQALGLSLSGLYPVPPAPLYRGYLGYPAISHFFGLMWLETRLIFSPMSYMRHSSPDTKNHIRANIDKVLDGRFRP